MKKIILVFLSLILSTMSWAAPTLQMNRAFNAITELVPFITQKEKFLEKKNEKVISENIKNIRNAFNDSKHEEMLKLDLFAPSYKMMKENISRIDNAFSKGNKDYAHWMIKDITSQCLDCHTRLPSSHSSSFQDGALQIDESKFVVSYNLGLAQMIVRKYPEAEATFTKVIDEKFLKNDFRDLDKPFKQMLLIESKVMRNPTQMIIFLKFYQAKKNFPEAEKKNVGQWLARLEAWKNNPVLKSKLENEKAVEGFIQKTLTPLFKKDVYVGDYDVDLLISSGLLSNFLFEHPESKLAPEIVFWIGRVEKYLKRENYFGSGDLFLKECIQRYPKNPIAKKCFIEYQESVEFEFSGSSGVHIPDDVKAELQKLKSLLPQK